LTVLPVAYDQRLREHRLNMQDLCQRLGESVAMRDEFAIPARISVAEATSLGRTIWEHNAPGIQPVRVGYSYLLGRVMSLAGQAQRSEADIAEGANHGNSNA
jgi:hypothetical protein